MLQKLDDQARTLEISDISENDSWTEQVTVSQELLDRFIDISRDHALAHVSSEHAQKMGYAGRLVHGFLGNLCYSRILGMYLPGSNTVIHQFQVEMLAPVYVDDILTYEVKVQRVIPAVKAVRLTLTATNQNGIVVNRGIAMCVFRP